MNSVDQAVANPCGLEGVEFVEFTGADENFYRDLMTRWGFTEVSRFGEGHISLFRQNSINFIVNQQRGSFAYEFSRLHGPSICSTGFKVKNAQEAFRTAVHRGARPYHEDGKKGATRFPAVYGIGDSLIYFVDPALREKLYQNIFSVPEALSKPKGLGFQEVDHFTNNVPVGEMQKWCDFYTQIFGFRETRYFDIRGKQTGLISKVMRSPCGTFAVPINEPADSKSQIQEYLDEYKGSGIQHLALLTPKILDSVPQLKSNKVDFLTPPPHTYYGMLKERLPAVSEDLDTLEKNAILVDGDHDGYLLQIFSKNIIGPIFFEVIQRKGHSGFGEGNFQALFDAIERDQKERGYL